MQQKNISVSKTARYFVSAEITEKTEQLWFVCHGYAQLANYFLKNFGGLDPEQNTVIAPEGLHRFYWKGFSDRVVASWMTKEDRENDIKDYVNFLDAVYNEVLSVSKRKDLKINVLGFSQGTATVCRWIANKNVLPDNLILWAGAFPSDMDLKADKTVFNAINTYIVVGDSDEFIKDAEILEHQKLLNDNEIRFELIRFKGKHEIDKETLLELSRRL